MRITCLYFVLPFIGFLFFSSCAKDKIPLKKSPDIITPCDCDITPYRDCYCDSNQPILCECNKTDYKDRDCDCDMEDPICPCDSTPYMDCYCDNYDPVYNCPCDRTQYRDCDCDSLQPIYDCPCGTVSRYKDCACDTGMVYNCPCDLTAYKDCDCDKDTTIKPLGVSFKNQVLPLLQSKCGSCHYSGSVVEDFNSASASYNNVMNYVIVGDPASSRIILLIETGQMPADGNTLTPQEFKNIENWIKEGAKNN